MAKNINICELEIEAHGVCYFTSELSVCLKYFKIIFKEIKLHQIGKEKKERELQEKEGAGVLSP